MKRKRSVQLQVTRAELDVIGDALDEYSKAIESAMFSVYLEQTDKQRHRSNMRRVAAIQLRSALYRQLSAKEEQP